MLVTKQQLMARIFTADDPDRLALQQVRIALDGSATATNGHVAVTVWARELPSESDIPNVPKQLGAEPEDVVFIHGAAAAAAAKVTPKRSDMPGYGLARLTVETPPPDQTRGRVQIGSTDGLTHHMTATEQPEDLQYPNVQAVFPTGEPVLTVGLSPEYLERIAKYAKRFAHVGTPVVTMRFYGPGQPVEFWWEDARHVARGIVMPVAIGDKTVPPVIDLPEIVRKAAAELRNTGVTVTVSTPAAPLLADARTGPAR